MKNTKFIRVYIIVVEKAMKQMLEKGLLVQSRIFRIVHCMLNQIPCYSVLIVTFFSYRYSWAVFCVAAFAAQVLERGPNPRHGNKTDNAHPPIHPTKHTSGLQVYCLVFKD